VVDRFAYIKVPADKYRHFNGKKRELQHAPFFPPGLCAAFDLLFFR